MATVEVSKEDVLAAYADEQYKKLQREKVSTYLLMSIAPSAVLSRRKLNLFIL